MSNGGIDRFPVSQLPSRYQIARSAIYTRMGELNITTEKIGNKAYVNAQQLQLLDDLHSFIQSGRTTAEFIEMRGLQSAESGASSESAAPSSELSTGLSSSGDLVRLVSTIAAEVAARFQSPAPDPYAYYEILERAAQLGWQLRTSELADLLDLPPEEILRCGDRFHEAGFVFTRAGFRSQGEVAWRVSKQI